VTDHSNVRSSADTEAVEQMRAAAQAAKARAVVL